MNQGLSYVHYFQHLYVIPKSGDMLFQSLGTRTRCFITKKAFEVICMRVVWKVMVMITGEKSTLAGNGEDGTNF